MGSIRYRQYKKAEKNMPDASPYIRDCQIPTDTENAKTVKAKFEINTKGTSRQFFIQNSFYHKTGDITRCK